MRTLIVKTGNQKKMLMCWEEIYHQITDPHEFDFLKEPIYVNKETSLLFDFFKFSLLFKWNKYTSNGI